MRRAVVANAAIKHKTCEIRSDFFKQFFENEKASTLPNPVVAFDLLHFAVDLEVYTVDASTPVLKDERFVVRVRIDSDR